MSTFDSKIYSPTAPSVLLDNEEHTDLVHSLALKVKAGSSPTDYDKRKIAESAKGVVLMDTKGHGEAYTEEDDFSLALFLEKLEASTVPLQIPVDIDPDTASQEELEEAIQTLVENPEFIMATARYGETIKWLHTQKSLLHIGQGKRAVYSSAEKEYAYKFFSTFFPSESRVITDISNLTIGGKSISKSYPISRMTVRDISKDYFKVDQMKEWQKRQLATYRGTIARIADTLQTKWYQTASNESTVASDVKLETLVSLGSAESNTPQWHELRLGGIGGSDVGALMLAEAEYAPDNVQRLWDSKMGFPEPEIDRGYETPIGIGNAWEGSLVLSGAHALNVTPVFTKDTWADSTNSHHRANFDGLFEEDGKIVGLIEAKTGNLFDGHWGPESDGILGVPLNYRYQVAWYAGVAGLTKGVLVARLNDVETRYYRFDNSSYLADLYTISKRAVDDFWSLFTAVRDSGGYEMPRTTRLNGFPATDGSLAKPIASISEGFGLHLDSKEKRALRAECRGVVQNYVNDPETMAKYERFAQGHDYDRASNQLFYENFLKEAEPEERPLWVGIDIETNSMVARRGSIIEVSVVTMDADGNMEVAHSSLYDVPEKSRGTIGTGDPIHEITLDMLEGYPVFGEDEAENTKILDLLKSGVMVAHNASFEDQWLSIHLPGYAEAVENGEITILDSQSPTRYLATEANRYKLETLVEYMGYNYQGQHHALTDTLMMLQALNDLNYRLVNTELLDSHKVKNTPQHSIRSAEFEKIGLEYRKKDGERVTEIPAVTLWT